MHKFYLFKKSNKFYLSNNRVIYSLLIIFLCGAYFLGDGDQIDTPIEKYFMLLALITFIAGGVLKFIGLGKYERINGLLDGFLILDKDFIQIEDEIFPIETIKRIQISNDDFSGKFVNYGKGNLNPALSNGVNNFVILHLLSGEVKKNQYELVKSDDFQKLRYELITYHNKDKIDFWTLANILGETSSNGIAELKKEIEKESTTANRQQA